MFYRSRRSRIAIRLLLLLIVSILTIGALSLPIALRPSNYQLSVGDVAPQDIQAPRSLSYTAQTLTDQAREEAARQVASRYLPADPAITRRQIERLRLTLNYITTVRLDAYASAEQKQADLDKLQDIRLLPETQETILALTPEQWDKIQQESLSVLEQVMRRTIRDDQLADTRAVVPSLISFSLPEKQAAIVAELVTAFIVPTSLFSEEQTEAARQQARAAIAPVSRTYVAGEIIARRGQVITPVIWEALREFGLIQSENSLRDFAAVVAITLVVASFVLLYFNRRRIDLVKDLRGLLVVALAFVLFLFAARLLVTNRTVVPYIFPLAALGMAIGSLYSIETGLIVSLSLSVLTAYGLSSSLDLTLFYVLTSYSGILVLGKGRRIASFFTAGIVAGLVGAVVIFAYRLPDPISDWIGISTLSGAALLNGLASASLALLLQYVFATILGKTTAIQLLELSRPDHPLLQVILQNAPGSYQHSLQVANMAEHAAELIGADALLTRVGAIYHDAGKAANPPFFVENQVPGKIDAHDDMDPVTSAATIIQHIHQGVSMARKHRLPPRVIDFIREHHGTLVTRYQYSKAVEAAGNDPSKVDIERFRYPGPRPQSRETAILMLADNSEARARAEVPQNEDELRAIIKKAIDFCQKEGQLDDTSLTLRDLNMIADSFANTLRNTYHPRLKYPELQPAEQPAAEQGLQAGQAIEVPSRVEESRG